ncbi:serine hydrolase [Thalassobaculum sp.]|uniref:serine hydrolase n=1 Tax=Thalassobaculum sp. TaxID=2022740 RepID=UPI0032EC722B
MQCFRRSFATLTATALLAAMPVGPVSAQTPGALRPTPPAFVPPLLTEQMVDGAVAGLDGLVEAAMARTGVPGVAVAVVYRDQVVYARGFGVREAGRPEPVDTDTVFLLASVSKPIASTVVATVVGRGLMDWNEPIRNHFPAAALSDPYVTAHVSVADLLSHRSGLYTAAGDLLEDLGYGRDYILSRLDRQPLDRFRASYHYSNYGYTLGGEAAARAAGTTWEDLADKALFEPLGMTRSSYRHADYLAHRNRASIHVRVGDEWVARHDRQPDAQAPAGGASGSIADVAQYLRLQLGNGTVDGRTLVDPAALAVTHAPHAMPGLPRTPLSRPGFYGLGWNVSYDDLGRLEIGHAGAFYLGTSTFVDLIPGEQLGIAVLTNGQPIGVPEGIAKSFLDIARNGTPTVDWFGLFGSIFQAMFAADMAAFDYTPRPATARPPLALTEYVGRYDNGYYGALDVSLDGDRLTMTLGPQSARTSFSLTHYDGDTFIFVPPGENASLIAGVGFRLDPSGGVSEAVIDFYDRNGLGTFVRSVSR